ncbi:MULTISPECIES: DUF551 domain-containing protein [Enterobacter cloacae complex]|uniref:DUF551 domain-containing protein n=1 Tax=Enterobacter cloacae complex TaxID=354276 RepID=UPI000B5013C7|nr:DUF551 domain-containing protein [Enterobacter hormaechei]ELJ9635644.1 DUF551 domain-containing protein [Enterobacter hormaechei]MBJ6510167.1 DUF551 domain-containing protein [Enterobacter hormaechei]MBJ6607343.1 DUF551 domain-containing protein [Enterobacter hormaechei]MBK4230651.1 DUF551 domain-containing protein [Enterobacter hormaechei]MBK4319576.1 DUF551 domain-containing protein [Enterobacter hormaechei]
MTLTKDWLLKTIAALEEERDAVPGAVNEDAVMALEAMKLALASLEAEPVAWLLSGGGAKNHVSFDSGNAYADPLREVTPLYTAHPAPVSVPAAMEMDDDFDSAFEHGKAVGWNAYRAAMLQSFGNSEQLNSPVIPDGWVACSDRMPEQFKAILAFNEYGEVWSGAYDRYWNFYCDNLLVEHVTHWMPLPNPPKE